MTFEKGSIVDHEVFGVHAVYPNPNVLVIVQRQGEILPDYEIAGHTRCHVCDTWCWLDVAVMKTILDAKATPVCAGCADGVTEGGPIGNARDL